MYEFHPDLAQQTFIEKPVKEQPAEFDAEIIDLEQYIAGKEDQENHEVQGVREVKKIKRYARELRLSSHNLLEVTKPDEFVLNRPAEVARAEFDHACVNWPRTNINAPASEIEFRLLGPTPVYDGDGHEIEGLVTTRFIATSGYRRSDRVFGLYNIETDQSVNIPIEDLKVMEIGPPAGDAQKRLGSIAIFG